MSDLSEAQAAALEMLQDLRQNDPSATEDFSGWTLRVTDAAGAVVFSLDLDSPIQ